MADGAREKGDGSGKGGKRRKTEACMCIYGGEREERERTLRNFFAELISLMRPDHLTGVTPLFFPSFFPRVACACIQLHVCIGTFRETFFPSCMHGYSS